MSSKFFDYTYGMQARKVKEKANLHEINEILGEVCVNYDNWCSENIDVVNSLLSVPFFQFLEDCGFDKTFCGDFTVVCNGELIFSLDKFGFSVKVNNSTMCISAILTTIERKYLRAKSL